MQMHASLFAALNLAASSCRGADVGSRNASDERIRLAHVLHGDYVPIEESGNKYVYITR